MPDGVKTASKSLLRRLHPRLARWFGATFADFTDAQLRCVPSILKRESILFTSPTGSGKTLAAFLGVFDHLLRELDVRSHSLGVHCLYDSPLAGAHLRHRQKSARADRRDELGEGATHSCPDRRHERE